LIEKLGKAHTQGTSKEDTQQRINIVDEESKQNMTHTECISQKLKSGRICFPPKLVIWIKCKLTGRVVGSCSKGTLDVSSNPTVPVATTASLYLKARYSYLRTP
jgi:hypothetical protein